MVLCNRHWEVCIFEPWGPLSHYVLQWSNSWSEGVWQNLHLLLWHSHLWWSRFVRWGFQELHVVALDYLKHPSVWCELFPDMRLVLYGSPWMDVWSHYVCLLVSSVVGFFGRYRPSRPLTILCPAMIYGTGCICDLACPVHVWALCQKMILLWSILLFHRVRFHIGLCLIKVSMAFALSAIRLCTSGPNNSVPLPQVPSLVILHRKLCHCKVTAS